MQLNRLRYLWEYDDLIRELVHAIKYRPSEQLCHRIGEEITKHTLLLFDGWENWDIIVPMPISPTHKKKRGFNQCTLIAQAIQKQLQNKPMVIELLKNRSKRSQASLKHHERMAILRQIAPIKAGKIAGKRILLIEDIITTGATVAASCYALKSAGAESIDLLALARTNVWPRFRRIIHSRIDRLAKSA
jgi:ComF family protein